MEFKTYQGKAIESVFEPLARLRVRVFRDWPYLYEGSLAYEKDYLQTYFNAERALLFAVFSGRDMVGATTCIPLADETAEIQAPFLQAGYNVDKLFYFGESILLPAYRGSGLGHQFFEVRERHALSFGQYDTTCFCGVVRPEDHPARPEDYAPLDAFWTKRGYQKAPGLQASFSWLDIGAHEETAKPMQFWLRHWA